MFFQATTDSECCPDWVIKCQNFVCTNAIQDAILRSLFTERQDPTCNEGGAWFAPQRGSLLHTLGNETVNQAIPLAEDYARDALQWLENDGVVTGLTVVAAYDGCGGIEISVNFTQPTDCELVVNGTPNGYGWAFNGYFN